MAITETLLRRYDARVLSPVDAVVFGDEQPLSTVYRARTLLVPQDLIQRDDVSVAANKVLETLGVFLDWTAVGPTVTGDAAFTRMPYTVPLRPTGLRPVTVDAWVALQTLRSAGKADSGSPLALAAPRIGLEHLLFGHPDIGGEPASEPHSGPALLGLATYDQPGGGGRSPVGLVLPAPRRRSEKELIDAGVGRRPVVAVLDTGLRPHPWLDVTGSDRGPLGFEPDGFAVEDQTIQTALRLAQFGMPAEQMLADVRDAPVVVEPLVGELDTHTGHGTFIAGIVRQVAADARVLAIRIMHSDGIVLEGDLLRALYLLAERTDVDVLSLSLGYYDERPADTLYTSLVGEAIGLLTDRGTVVVASAGNDATNRPSYPAALGALPQNPKPVISVGALNPNGTKALFSNDASWVHAWDSGAAVVSTFPTDVNGSQSPVDVLPGSGGVRESLDPDDYSCGFAVWSGTSFAAPKVAGRVAATLLELAERGGAGAALDLPGVDAARVRAANALRYLGLGA
jgi:hypothetical protein